MSEEQIEYEVEEQVDVSTLESWKVDSMIQEVKDNNEDLKRYKEILEKRKLELDNQFLQKKEQIEKKNHYLLTTLGQYALQQENLKETKTQRKWTGLSGDIIIKKAKQQPQKPNKDQIENFSELYPELIEVEEVKKLNWKDLKSKLIIQNERIFNKETGEDLSHLLDIEVKNEEITVK